MSKQDKVIISKSKQRNSYFVQIRHFIYFYFLLLLNTLENDKFKAERLDNSTIKKRRKL